MTKQGERCPRCGSINHAVFLFRCWDKGSAHQFHDGYLAAGSDSGAPDGGSNLVGHADEASTTIPSPTPPTLDAGVVERVRAGSNKQHHGDDPDDHVVYISYCDAIALCDAVEQSKGAEGRAWDEGLRLGRQERKDSEAVDGEGGGESNLGESVLASRPRTAARHTVQRATDTVKRTPWFVAVAATVESVRGYAMPCPDCAKAEARADKYEQSMLQYQRELKLSVPESEVINRVALATDAAIERCIETRVLPDDGLSRQQRSWFNHGVGRYCAALRALRDKP